MPLQVFTLSLVAGGALVALWVVARFRRHRPDSVGLVAAHLVAATIAGATAIPVAIAVAHTLGPVGALMLVGFPSLVYVLVASAWLLLYLQRSARPFR